MLTSRAAVTELPFVEGSLNYLAAMAETPYNYTYEPDPGTPKTNAVYEPHELPIRDARGLGPSLSLDREGFVLRRHRSAVTDFADEAELESRYYPESAELVRQATGAARVIVFDHTVRRRVPQVEDRAAGAPRQPVTRVHNDYTLISGPQRVRDLLGKDAEAALRRRFAFINLWRPIRGPLRDAPLAVCDAQTVKLEDFVASQQIYRDRRGETYVVRFSPAHRWFYVPEMAAEEALLIKCYDSVEDVARFVPHSAFEDPTTPPDALPRESIEIRTIAFWD